MATELRVPPHNTDAEIAILGCLFSNPRLINKIRPQLDPDDFYQEANGHIYAAILKTKDPDIVTVADYLRRNELLDKIGGMERISVIISSSLTSVGYQAYVDIVREYSVRRKVISNCLNLVEKAHGNGPISSLSSDLKAAARDIQAKDMPGVHDTNALLQQLFKDIERRKQDQNFQVGIQTGLYDIDRHIGGLEPKSLTYLMGRPSMGKTALALSIAENIAQAGYGLVLFFSLEMGDMQIMRRRLSARSSVYLSRIRHGNIEDSQWPDLVEAADELEKAEMMIVDRPKYKVVEHLVDLTESIATEQKLAAIFVDHIQLMRSLRKFNNRHLELSHISNSLKDLSKDLDMPVIGLSQLSRDVEKRNNKRPVLSDLKESGDLEQDADIVIGIYRKDKESTVMELGGLKGRDIGTWQSEVKFDRFTQRVL